MIVLTQTKGKKMATDPMFKLKTAYEWAVEYSDENGDIEDIHHADKFSEIVGTLNNQTNEGRTGEYVLIRDTYTEADGLQERSWAYPSNKTLPSEFDSGHKVPNRYAKQFNKGIT